MKGWRTILVTIGMAILPIIQVTGAADLGLTGVAATVYSLIGSAVNIYMRSITTGPVGTKINTGSN